MEKGNTKEQILDVSLDLMFMGSLGEGYSILNKILPNTYRVNDVPEELYDGMIIVTNPTPTEINLQDE